MKVTIYSDGSSDPNPGIGGWAAVLRAGKHEKVLTGNDPDTTNNRMELTAAVQALAALNRPCEVEFYTDSEYVRRGISEWIGKWVERDWKRKNGEPIPNADLWQKLLPLTKQHQIEWHWVRGHAGNAMNEQVDQLAREARLEITPGLEFSADTPRLYLKSSYLGKHNVGGWGIFLEIDNDSQQFSGNAHNTTNNRMEIMAAIEALHLLPHGSSLQLFTTSDYLFQGATKWIHGWRRRKWQKRDGSPVANSDLWQKLDVDSKNFHIQWVNAKGQDYEGMEIASKVASDAARLLADSG